MPGMGSGLKVTAPTIVTAFKAALLHQGLLVLVLLLLVVVAWRALRMAVLRRALPAGTPPGTPPGTSDGTSAGVCPAGRPGGAEEHRRRAVEPAGRQVLRVGFGLLWILDGVLQAQSAMPLGLPADVVQPAAATGPGWLRALVDTALTTWTYHPVTAAAAAVWIQVGIGIFLLVAPRGRWSRAAGAVSATWGLGVWVFGEALGGLLSPGASFLFGLPGAAAFYVLAGLLVALPDRAWSGCRLGRSLLAAMGALYLAMALLQGFPGRGFWRGHLAGGRVDPLASMSRQMAATPQPHFLSGWLDAFAGFDLAHAFAVNLVVVAVLAAVGAALLVGRAPLLWPALAAATVVGLADWVLVQDLGFLGGLGTDPNSMVPVLLVLFAGRRALAAPGPALPVVVPDGPTQATWRDRLTSEVERLGRQPSYGLRVLAALAAAGVVLIGAVPMAVASMDPNADPILAQAVDGTPNATDFRAPPFQLVDQAGRPVSLASLRGKTLVVTFLDPVCTTDCPVIARELVQADRLLGPTARRRVELVAIDVNPRYEARAYLVAFDHQEGLTGVPNWRFLTGGAAELRRTWNAYGIQVQLAPGGAMVAHSELAYVIDARGRVRWALDTNIGPATAASRSSFATTLAGVVRQSLAGA